MNQQHRIVRDGVEYCTYGGLLAEAHQRGLVQLTISVHCNPGQLQPYSATAENPGGHLFDSACVEAAARFRSKKSSPNDDEEVYYEALGACDATEFPAISRPAMIRLAEIRAKARALRDALGVGVLAIEEIGTEFEGKSVLVEPPPADVPLQVRNRGPASGVGRDDLATSAQIRAVYVIGRELSLTEAQVDERCTTMYGRPPQDASKAEVSNLIGALKALNAAP